MGNDIKQVLLDYGIGAVSKSLTIIPDRKRHTLRALKDPTMDLMRKNFSECLRNAVIQTLSYQSRMNIPMLPKKYKVPPNTSFRPLYITDMALTVFDPDYGNFMLYDLISHFSENAEVSLFFRYSLTYDNENGSYDNFHKEYKRMFNRNPFPGFTDLVGLEHQDLKELIEICHFILFEGTNQDFISLAENFFTRPGERESYTISELGRFKLKYSIRKQILPAQTSSQVQNVTSQTTSIFAEQGRVYNDIQVPTRRLKTQDQDKVMVQINTIGIVPGVIYKDYGALILVNQASSHPYNSMTPYFKHRKTFHHFNPKTYANVVGDRFLFNHYPLIYFQIFANDLNDIAFLAASLNLTECVTFIPEKVDTHVAITNFKAYKPPPILHDIEMKVRAKVVSDAVAEIYKGGVYMGDATRWHRTLEREYDSIKHGTLKTPEDVGLDLSISIKNLLKNINLKDIADTGSMLKIAANMLEDFDEISFTKAISFGMQTVSNFYQPPYYLRMLKDERVRAELRVFMPDSFIDRLISSRVYINPITFKKYQNDLQLRYDKALTSSRGIIVLIQILSVIINSCYKLKGSKDPPIEIDEIFLMIDKELKFEPGGSFDMPLPVGELHYIKT
jgi:hypothetical protein